MFDSTKASLKAMVSEVLVSLMRVEWKQGMLRHYVESVGNDLGNTATPKLEHFLEVIKRVIREGF